ncbi:MAG: hypothetical protein Q4D82_03385 [Neisseria sp.]|nr:hypothetical protein [Neisseria sp.]
MNIRLSALAAALLLAACTPESERNAASEISASEIEAEEAATNYQTASDFQPTDENASDAEPENTVPDAASETEAAAESASQ